MIFRSCRTCIFALLLFLFAAPTFCEEEPSPQNSWDGYEVIVNKNIFSRNRLQQVERTAGQDRMTTPASARAPENFLVLRGVTRDAEGFIAFIEDTRTYNVSRARVGDSVTEGVVKDMSLDHMEFELNGEARRIEIGMDLGGMALHRQLL